VSAPANRLAGLAGAELDAVVIGGGMAGAGVARDLALRGASVALFEKGDFASGTSSKSSKLIHGGLRYLELGDFQLVRESLREKKTLERLAPHLVRPLPFLVPVYRGAARGLIKVRLGMWLYDLLTPGKTTERTVYTLTEQGLDALRAYAQTPVRFTPLKSEPLLRLLICDLVGEGRTRASMTTLRDDIAGLAARLDEAEASAELLPHRRKYLLLVIGFLRQLLDLHLELVDAAERELTSEQMPAP
jgi:hypothetical protein